MKQHFERERLIWGADLSSTEKLILLAVNSFADGEGECFPSVPTIARLCSLKDRTVQSALSRLQKQGAIERHIRTKEGRQSSNLYKVRFDHIPQCNSGGVIHDHRGGDPRSPDLIIDLINKEQINELHTEADRSAIAQSPAPSPISNSSIPESEPNGQVSEIDLTAPEHQTGQLVKPTVDAVDQNSAAAAKKPRKKKKDGNAAEIYASLADFEGFDKFWCWYLGQIAALPRDRNGRKPSEGSKAEAAIAWRDCIEAVPGERDALRKGSAKFDFGQVGVPHACRYLSKAYYRNPLDADRGSDFLSSQCNENASKTDDGGVGSTNHQPGEFEADFLAFLARSYCPKLPGMQSAEWDEFTARDWVVRNQGARLKNAEAAYKEFLANQKQRQDQESARREALAPVEMTADEVEALREARARARQIVQEAILKRA